jgi:hypothetical protein
VSNDKSPPTHTTNPPFDTPTPADVDSFYSVFKATRGNKVETARRLSVKHGQKITRHVVSRIVQEHGLDERLKKEKVVEFRAKNGEGKGARAASAFDFLALGKRPHAEVVHEFRGLVGAYIQSAKEFLERIVLADSFPELKVSDLLKLWELYSAIVAEDERLQAIERRKKGQSRVTASYDIHGEVHQLKVLAGGKK